MQVTHGSENELKQPHSPLLYAVPVSVGENSGCAGAEKDSFFSLPKEHNWDEISYVKGIELLTY